MKTLSYRQASACENAKTPANKCDCRCGGAAHGRGLPKGGAVDPSTLPLDDPHHAKRQLTLDELTPEEREAGFASHKGRHS